MIEKWVHWIVQVSFPDEFSTVYQQWCIERV